MEKLSRRGLSTFLAEHEDCGGGFEVQRREDSAGSIVRVICGGCRQSIEYPAASDEELIVGSAGVPKLVAAGGEEEAGRPETASERREGIREERRTDEEG